LRKVGPEKAGFAPAFDRRVAGSSRRRSFILRANEVIPRRYKGEFRMPQAPMPEEMNVYQNAEARFEVAANKLGLEQGLYRYLKYPSKEITLYIPIGWITELSKCSRDNRVLHSTVRGPARAESALRRTFPLTKCARWRPG